MHAFYKRTAAWTGKHNHVYTFLFRMRGIFLLYRSSWFAKHLWQFKKKSFHARELQRDTLSWYATTFVKLYGNLNSCSGHEWLHNFLQSVSATRKLRNMNYVEKYSQIIINYLMDHTVLRNRFELNKENQQTLS